MGSFREKIRVYLTAVALTIAFQSQVCAQVQSTQLQSSPSQAEQLFALGNQARSAIGLRPLKWDAGLAAAALEHCKRMAAEGPIAHRYGDEEELTVRASRAGAHFSLIEENIAIGQYPADIHQGWMNSPHHRTNMLSPAVNAVGYAIVIKGQVLYAVADYAQVVTVLNASQVEAAFAEMLRAKGVAVEKDATDARAYCATSGPFRGARTPSFAIRWQGPDVSRLPEQLEKKIASSAYRTAEVGSCPPQDVEGAFTLYRTAVLLY